MLKDIRFFSFIKKYKKWLLDWGLDASKKVVHKVGEYLGNKTADTITKSNDDDIEKHESAEEILIPPEERERNIKQIEKSIIKMEHYKISKLLNDPTASKFVTKNGSK